MLGASNTLQHVMRSHSSPNEVDVLILAFIVHVQHAGRMQTHLSR